MVAEANCWLVLRFDDAGNAFLVADGLDMQAANALVETLTARGHKQTYGTFEYTDRSERAALLKRFKANV